MSLRDYITVDDITNKIYNRFELATRQEYVDMANDECEDLAVRRGVDPVDISATTHFKLKQYLTHYAVSQLAQDNIGFNNTGVVEDKYENLFKREQYLLQNLKPDIVVVVFTGEEQTPDNRAVQSQRIVRG